MPAIDAASTDRYGRRVLASLRAHWRILPVYMTIVWAINFLRVLALTPGRSLAETLEIGALAHFSVFWLAGPFTFVAIACAEGLRLHGVARALVTFAFIGVGVGASSIALVATNAEVIREGVDTLLVSSRAAFLSRYWWFNVAMGLLLAGYLAEREREAAMVRAAREAELERAQTQRTVLDSRLKVLQARVEPDLLFGVLSEAIELYPRDRGAANGLLDDLIAYLRAALPHLRRDSSTVMREVALAQAWLRLAPSLRKTATTLTSSVAPEVADAQFPALVLLPIVEGAVSAGARAVVLTASTHAAQPGHDAGAQVSIAIDATLASAAWPAERVQEIRGIVATALPEAGIEVMRQGALTALQVTWLVKRQRSAALIPG